MLVSYGLGAPKIKVMQLIDQYEKQREFFRRLRLYKPSGRFRFNVLIRSMMSNQVTGYLSFQAGGGITAYSNADKEWEECLLKAKAIKAILST